MAPPTAPIATDTLAPARAPARAPRLPRAFRRRPRSPRGRAPRHEMLRKPITVHQFMLHRGKPDRLQQAAHAILVYRSCVFEFPTPTKFSFRDALQHFLAPRPDAEKTPRMRGKTPQDEIRAPRASE